MLNIEIFSLSDIFTKSYLENKIIIYSKRKSKIWSAKYIVHTDVLNEYFLKIKMCEIYFMPREFLNFWF